MPRATIIQRIFDRFGYRIIPNWRLEKLHFANNLKQLFDKKEIKCVLDIGANVGQYGDFLRNDVGFSGKIISFEPVRDTYRILRSKTANDNNWTAMNYAIGDADIESEINVMASSRLSSLLEPDQTHHALKNNDIQRKEPVSIRRLDSLSNEIMKCSGGSYFLKMDTQGYDLQAFLGARGLWGRIEALQTEMSIIPIYKNAPLFTESIQLFNNQGYWISGMYPVSQSKSLRLIEFDCIMVRDTF